jgi:hypothetical protein
MNGARSVRRVGTDKLDACDHGAALGSALAARKGRVAAKTLVKPLVLVFGLALVLSLGGCASDNTDPQKGVEDGHLLGPGRW